MTASKELSLARLRLKEWYKAFPKCRVAASNHGLRWLARARECYIPSEILKPYKELLAAPKGWTWHEEIFIKTKSPFRCIHGIGFSGALGHRTAAFDSGISTVIGHLHSGAGVNYINNGSTTIWGMNVGCLMNPEHTLANGYSKYSRLKGVLSTGVVLNNGKVPLVVPYGSL